MGNYHAWKPILVSPDDLIRFAWSAPLRDLAALVDLSDVGLRKQLVGYGVPLPPQGYWNKTKAGKVVPTAPSPEPRKPGQLGGILVDNRFANVIAIADPIPAKGPFASALVPENLDDLLEQEVTAIGTVKVPKSLGHAPPGLFEVLKSEEKRRIRSAKSGWSFDGPRFDAPISQRKLRIWSALYSTIVKRGHTGNAYEHEGQLMCLIRIGDSPIAVEIEILGRGRHYNDRRLLENLPANTPLRLEINPGLDGRFSKSWQDGKDGSLEEKIGIIAASMIVAGETVFRAQLRQAEERAAKELARLEEEKRQRTRVLNERRIQALKASGDLLRQAKEIRELVELLHDAVNDGSQQVDHLILAAWARWALEEANKLDPIQSGQFREHLLPPETDT